MKARLLKRIRKRYEIRYWPNGLFIDREFYSGPLLRLVDHNSLYRDFTYSIGSKLTKEDAHKAAYEKLLMWIQQDYGTFKSKRVKITSEKLWY